MKDKTVLSVGDRLTFRNMLGEKAGKLLETFHEAGVPYKLAYKYRGGSGAAKQLPFDIHIFYKTDKIARQLPLLGFCIFLKRTGLSRAVNLMLLVNQGLNMIFDMDSMPPHLIVPQPVDGCLYPENKETFRKIKKNV